LLSLRVAGRQGHAAGAFAIEADLKRVLPGSRQWNVEYEHGAGLHIHDAGGRLAKLHRTLTTQQLTTRVVYEAYANGVRANFSTSSPYSENQMSPGVNRGEVRQPDMLKHAEHAELALLIDQGIISDNRKIEVQGSADSNRRDNVVLLDLVHDVHSFGNLAEHRVNLIEMRLRRMGNEELAAAGVLPSMRHG
jgi:hypothetical protein